MAKKICKICGKEMGMMNGKVKCADGYICYDCFKALGGDSLGEPAGRGALAIAKSMSVEEFREYSKKRRKELEIIKNFKPTLVPAEYAKFDDNSRTMILAKEEYFSYKPEYYTLFAYDQIIGVKLIEDGATIISGGIGTAIMGGVLAGETGAIIGGMLGQETKPVCTELTIKITVAGYKEPDFCIDIVTTERKRSGFVWNYIKKCAENIMSKLQLIIADNQKQAKLSDSNPQIQKPDPIEEIRKYKGLLNDGIITEEEFERKKEQLLEL